MKKSAREILFVLGCHLLGLLMLGVFLYDMFIGRPG